MASNLAIDPDLLNEAKLLGHHKTKTEAVNTALLEYIQHHKQLQILDLFGTINYDPNDNYKKGRHRK